MSLKNFRRKPIKKLCIVKCYNEYPKEEASHSAYDSFIGEKLGLEGRVDIQKAKRRMERVLNRDDSSYKLAGMKENDIFEERLEIWWGLF